MVRLLIYGAMATLAIVLVWTVVPESSNTVSRWEIVLASAYVAGVEVILRLTIGIPERDDH